MKIKYTHWKNISRYTLTDHLHRCSLARYDTLSSRFPLHNPSHRPSGAFSLEWISLNSAPSNLWIRYHPSGWSVVAIVLLGSPWSQGDWWRLSFWLVYRKMTSPRYFFYLLSSTVQILPLLSSFTPHPPRCILLGFASCIGLGYFGGRCPRWRGR